MVMTARRPSPGEHFLWTCLIAPLENIQHLTPCSMWLEDVWKQLSEPINTVWPLPSTPQDWAQTPVAVQRMCTPARQTDAAARRVETLETRYSRIHDLIATASSESPYKKPRSTRRHHDPERRRKKGHLGHRQALLPP